MRVDNGSLLLSAADKRDEGQYTCAADNGVRPAIAKTVNVTINGMERKPNIFTLFQNSFSHIFLTKKTLHLPPRKENASVSVI